MTSHPLLFRLARSFPPAMQKQATEAVRQAGYAEDGMTWLGASVFFVLFAGILGSLALGLGGTYVNEYVVRLLPGFTFSLESGALVGLFLGLFSGIALRFLSLYYAIEHRRNRVEEILPDFLLLMAGNIRAGMTSFSAFKSSSRPEFGPLADEIKSVTTRSLGTDSFGSALATISDRIQSKSLNESVRFFLQAIRSGGKVAQLLENTATDLRRTMDLKRELETSTRTYVIFVAFVMMIATPLLMAVSVQFVGLITRIQSQNNFGSSDSAALGFLGGQLSITPGFLESMAFVLLFGNAILAGIFMGTIGSGKPLLGLRFTPPLFIVSLGAFFLAKGVLGGILGG